jgi:hypothetical protein
MTYRMKFTTAAACAVALLAGPVPASVCGFASMSEAGHRDKTGTTGVQEKGDGSQATVFKALASRVSFQAEGTGLEPAAPSGHHIWKKLLSRGYGTPHHHVAMCS